MDKKLFIKQITLAIWLTFSIALAHAGQALWTFTPLTATTIDIAGNQTATINYRITNQSKKAHTLIMKAISGITQITSSGYCSSTALLNYQQSCILSLVVNGAALSKPILAGPVLCDQSNRNQCYQPSITNSLHITPTSAVTYTIGGSVFGLSGTLLLNNNNNDTLTINTDGTFTFATPLPPGDAYSVTVDSQPASQTCTVTNQSGTVINANITNITVNCSTNTQNIGGNVSGLAALESVTLQNNGGNDLVINANGSFTFSAAIAQSAPYNVTIDQQPNNQTCTVTNGHGTVSTTDINNVQVTCSTNAYYLGGTVSGLSSGTVVLENNLGDTISINNNGTFTFPMPVVQGLFYNVTVSTQPAAQTCTVTNQNGTMGNSDVTNIGVNCIANTTTLITSPSTLVLSATGRTEYGINGTISSGLARIITITNTGSNPAINLSITPPTWPSGTTHDATMCPNILNAGSSCTITITPGSTATSDGTNPCSMNRTAPIPDTIQISANNVTSVSTDVVVLDYGCLYQGGYLYAFDDSTSDTSSIGGKVLTTSDQAVPSPGVIWSSNGHTGGSGTYRTTDVSEDSLPGVDELSTSTTGSPSYSDFVSFFSTYFTNPNPFTSASFSACNEAINGACNTQNIITFYDQFITNNTFGDGNPPLFTASPGPTNRSYYAAGLCKATINSYSDWYLPAICEMGYDSNNTGCGTFSSPTLQNIQSSLIDLRYPSTPLTPLGPYWSSTEWSSDPSFAAAAQVFVPLGYQVFEVKARPIGVRCSRALTF